MFKKAKLWQLYIFPFLVIGIMLIKENVTLLLGRLQNFEDIAQNTSSIAEIDFNKLQKTQVKKVIDGDTIVIESGETVRYIGVDTPETVHPKKAIQCFGKNAAIQNKILVDKKIIYLEKDISDKDRYGRLLRYIYLPNPNSKTEVIFINEYLIEQGFGQIITYPPDVKYHNKFTDAQKIAQKEKRGLWQKCKP